MYNNIIAMTGARISSLLELAIKIQRFDVVKMLVRHGANPIHPKGSIQSGVLTLMEEYYEFGTNHYIRWLLHDHFLPSQVSGFIKQVMEARIFNKNAVTMFRHYARRHHSHALLLCGHEEMIRALVQHRKHGGDDLLTATDGPDPNHGRTALQIAADQGDLESLKVLFNL